MAEVKIVVHTEKTILEACQDIGIKIQNEQDLQKFIKECQTLVVDASFDTKFAEICKKYGFDPSDSDNSTNPTATDYFVAFCYLHGLKNKS